MGYRSYWPFSQVKYRKENGEENAKMRTFMPPVLSLRLYWEVE
jgi:hypothetical protein